MNLPGFDDKQSDEAADRGGADREASAGAPGPPPRPGEPGAPAGAAERGRAPRWQPGVDRLTGPLEVSAFLDVATAAAAALRDLHRTYGVHGALTADAFVVDADSGRMRVLPPHGGFGAEAREPLAASIARLGPYTAPEHTGRTPLPVDRRTDLYGLGVALYRALTGAFPFESEDAAGWFHAALARAPIRPLERVPYVPTPIADIVLKLLAKPPEARYQSARGTLADLERCRDAWAATRQVPAFELGLGDASEALSSSGRLYGREGELAALRDALTQVAASGGTRSVFVSGSSGIGKSALVWTLLPLVLQSGGYFVGAKCEPGGPPHGAISDALRDLVRQALTEPDERVRALARRLREAVGIGLGAVAELVPEISVLVGPLPAAPPPPAPEAQSRLDAALRNLVAAFASPERPVVLFVDDLQWADPTDVRTLERLVTDRDLGPTLVVGAFRDDELDPQHPLAAALARIEREAAPLSIRLGGLAAAPFAQLLGDLLPGAEDDPAPLAAELCRLTDGNPFLVTGLVRTLHRQGLLVVDPQARRWRWDLPAIRAAVSPEAAARVASEAIAALPDDARRALQAAACAGQAFETELVAAATGLPAERLQAGLQLAAQAQIVRPIPGAPLTSWTWGHDRWRQAVTESLTSDAIEETHLALAAALVRLHGEPTDPDQLLRLAGHVALGRPRIAGRAERLAYARLVGAAGAAATRRAAFARAAEHLDLALSLLPGGAPHELEFQLHRDRAAVACYLSPGAEAERFLARAEAEARDAIERAAVATIALGYFTNVGHYARGNDVGIRALAALGVDLSAPADGGGGSGEDEFAQLRRRLADTPAEALLTREFCGGPVERAVMDLLAPLLSCAYSSDPRLFMAATIRLMSLTLQHGQTDVAPWAYVMFAMLLVVVADDHEEAHRLGQVALRMTEADGRPHRRAQVTDVYGFTVDCWFNPAESQLAYHAEGYRAGLEAGDLQAAVWNLMDVLIPLASKGESLERVEQTAAELLAVSSRYAQDQGWYVAQEFDAERRRLRGEAPRAAAEFGPRAGGEPALTHLMLRRSLELEHACLLLPAEEALRAAAAWPEIQAVYNGTMIGHLAEFYRALVAAAALGTSPPSARAELRAILDETLARFTRIAHRAPDNFEHRRALLAAEQARLDGRDRDAAAGFDEAIQAARRHRFLRDAGLGAERAALFHLARGYEAVGHAYLALARGFFARWGAHAKVRNLEQRFPAAFGPSGGALGGDDVPRASLDAAAVVKASLALSSEVEIGGVVRSLLRTAIEQAGATSAALVLHDREPPEVAGRATVDRSVVELDVLPRPRAVRADDLPLTLLNYVSRTRQPVVLRDAREPSVFASDPYVRAHRTRSALGLPILNQRTLVATLYLENELVPDAFRPDRLAVLELVAAQAAISLVNVRLYDSLRCENAERRRAEEALGARERRHASLLRSLTSGVVLVDAAGKVSFANPMAASILRLGGLQIGADNAPPVRSVLPFETGALGSDAASEREVTFTRSDGRRTTLLVNAAPMRDGDGHFEGTIYSFVDVSDRKALEQQLQASQKMEVLGRLSGGIAHDFNNVLTAISGYAEIAEQRGPTDPVIRVSLEEIRQGTARAAALTRQLLAFARRQPSNPRAVDVSLLLDGLQNMLRQLLGERVELELALAGEPCVVEVDPGQLEQVVVNLAVNARDAMPDGGRLDIDVRPVTLGADEAPGLPPGPYVSVRVRDTGVGMSDEVKQHLFEPFFTTKPPGQGTGLGLSICFGIVQQHRGHLRVTSALGAGSTFEVLLPRVRSSVTGGASNRRPDAGSGEAVLLVEDEAAVRELLATVLRGAGYEVTTAATGAEAEQALARRPGPVQLLVTDIGLPDVSGVQLPAKLTALEPGTPVLFISGYADPSVWAAIPADRRCKGLPKPFTAAELLRAVRELLDRPRARG